MGRRTWDAGITAFLGGLKKHVETVHAAAPRT
jgi:hypothetical protein